MQQISIHILVMGDPRFFLTDLSLFGMEATPVSALLLFQCAVKLRLLNVIMS
jgi:hypothetical protein